MSLQSCWTCWDDPPVKVISESQASLQRVTFIGESDLWAGIRAQLRARIGSLGRGCDANESETL